MLIFQQQQKSIAPKDIVAKSAQNFETIKNKTIG